MRIDRLAEEISRRNVILFAGAGVSMNLGLPSFKKLAARIGEELGFDPDVFETFGDYLQLAEYYVAEKGSIGPLRSWMDTTWHSPEIKISESKVHNLLLKLDFPIIYTTNYDRWFERAHEVHHKKYVKIAKLADLVTDARGFTEIIKFHGDFDDDESIVLTETSYQRRFSFETALDIRLRADSLARPLLFIGYSLTDMNIRYLLYRLQELWRGSEAQRPKSFILLTQSNPIQEKLLELRGIEPIVMKGETHQLGLERFLETICKLVETGET
jgi:hypothetical protein